MIFRLSLTTSHTQWVSESGAVTPNLFREQPLTMANSLGKHFGRFGSFFGRFGSFLFCQISQSFLVGVWCNLPDERAYHKGFQDSFSRRLNERAEKIRNAYLTECAKYRAFSGMATAVRTYLGVRSQIVVVQVARYSRTDHTMT